MKDLSAYIDYTNLKEGATPDDIEQLCNEATAERFAAVCIPPVYVPAAKTVLEGSGVKIATVVGFPFGYITVQSKVEELDAAIAMGADELDMVIDLCALKAGDWQQLEREIEACLPVVTSNGKILKVIVESGILTDRELMACCELYGRHRVHFMKTSTGFADKGATVEAVRLMRAHLPAETAIKASGGVRNYALCSALIGAGASRIGCSAALDIMREYREQNKISLEQ